MTIDTDVVGSAVTASTVHADESFHGSAAGAVVAEVVDDLMNAVLADHGLHVRAVRSEVEHVSIIPSGVELTATAQVTGRARGFVYAEVALCHASTPVVWARGTFVVIETYRR